MWEPVPEDFRIWTKIREGSDAVLLSVGSMLKNTLEAAEILSRHNISAAVIRVSMLKPADRAFLQSQETNIPMITIEEHMMTGGFGEYLTGLCREEGYPVPALCIAVPDCYIPHGTHELLMRDAGLDAERIADRVAGTIGRKKE